ALPFPLCLSVLAPPECGYLEDVSVARGNVLLVDHGRRVDPERLIRFDPPPEPASCERPGQPAEPPPAPARFGLRLERAPLTHAEPLVRPASARALLAQNPHRAVPGIELRETAVPDGAVIRWAARQDLLGSGPTDRHFVAEIEEDGRASLRLGDGVLGARPAPGGTVTAYYRIGNGPAGNVSAEAIDRIVAPP